MEALQLLSKLKEMHKAVPVLVILIVGLPLGYFGLIYVSATSARFSFSNVGFADTGDLVEALLTRQLDIELYLDIEGHGILSIPVKSLEGQIYLEDFYMGVVSATEPFSIPASGTRTAHLAFHLDLSTISLMDIQQVVQAVSSHNGEIKIGFDGYVEPIIGFFPITVPLSYNVYTQTSSNAPQVTNMYWETTSCTVGEEVDFQLTVKNMFRDFSVDGTLDLIVREDIASGFDVNARVYHFPVQLSTGKSQTFRGIFVPYKQLSTRGFFLKAQWGTSVLAEQANSYPPRLSVTEGVLNLVDVYWTIDGAAATSCILGDEVVAHVALKASNAALDDTITVKIRKDIALAIDEDVEVVSFDVILDKDETREYTITFQPNEASGGSLRGYFVEIEGDLSWAMENSYPPRLTVNEQAPIEGTPSLQNVWWTVNEQVVTEAQQGQTVKAHIQIKAEGGNVQGTVTVRVRRDIPLWPDEDHKVQSFSLDLSTGQVVDLIVTFSASQKSGLTFRGYFIHIDFDSWGTTWTMASSYPSRLAVT